MTGQYEIDWSDHAQHLRRTARADADWYRLAAHDLVRPGDRLLADVGCGGAGMAAALAVAGPQARVVAVDGDEDVLAGAHDNLVDAGLDGRVELALADLAGAGSDLADALDGGADVIWASAVVHHAGDQQVAVERLAALLGPGGRLALAEGGLRARHLPWDVGVGEPGLEVRLEAANDRWFAGMRSELPESTRMPYGWTTALRRAGLGEVTTRSVLIERSAPLGSEDLALVADRLRHWVERLREADLLEAADLDAWDRLLDPDSETWLGQREDVFWLEVRSVHVGTAPS